MIIISKIGKDCSLFFLVNRVHSWSENIGARNMTLFVASALNYQRKEVAMETKGKH